MMLGEEQKHIPEVQPNAQPEDAGAAARANDIIDALVQTEAWQDSKRKKDDEQELYGPESNQ